MTDIAAGSTATERRHRPSSVLVQFVLLAVTWGSSFLFVAVGLTGLSPAQVVLGRLVAGAVTLGLICAIGRRRLPRGIAIWGHLLVVALLLCVIPFLLFAWAQQGISSGMASIYNATTPLMTVLVSLIALRAEPPTRATVLGLVVGFCGVLIVLGPWNGLGGGDVWSQLACLAATACYGTAFVYLRRFVAPRGLDAIPVATVQVGLGAAVMLLLAPAIAMGPFTLSVPVVLAVLALGAVGTGLAYVWNTNIVMAWGASNAAAVTYLTPVVGVLLGVVVLSERVSWNEPVGAVVVILGIAVAQGRLGRGRSGQGRVGSRRTLER
ncbi:drug/metabolite transporter (DMT)-like permease [Microbacterium resistens]|uniref:Drug/metabolite transporter (DMT)-like permease n=1 Tax=Microbacterium resistens TaxID=156977 RepID=A0ABU1SE76_9MICO|nr:DMT family transporter [Microbacterium resistens]MDR6867894.1 drug/metabolite transporter (DMT)-like permease [Microbacterium resistens]